MIVKPHRNVGFFCFIWGRGLISSYFFLIFTSCRSGGIGRHEGLKIPWTVMSVTVRARPSVLKRGSEAVIDDGVKMTKKGLE
jgi:hypothetical protein